MKSCVAQLLLAAAALEQVLDGLQRLVGDRDQEARSDEDVELARAEPTARAVEDGEVEDDEQVVLVLVDLRALVAREHVLEVQRVEVEVLLQPCLLDRAGAVDLDPAQALGRDLLYARGAGLSLSGRDEPSRAGTAAQPGTREVRHPPAPGVSSGLPSRHALYEMGTKRAQGATRLCPGRVARCYIPEHIAAPHPEGWRDWPDETPATIRIAFAERDPGEVPNPAGKRDKGLGDVGRVSSRNLRPHRRRRFFRFRTLRWLSTH